jgi:phosphonate degradation associated HDIG domain protein
LVGLACISCKKFIKQFPLARSTFKVLAYYEFVSGPRSDYSSNAPTNIEELFNLYQTKGSEPYGESLTQTQHALQCAALAKADNASDELVVAALFHDVGHLVADLQNDEGFELEDMDDNHEAIGARTLAPLFGPGVAQSVSLHVTAKRWRCARQPTYLEQLSSASRATLIAQGGPLSEEACQHFEAHPGFDDALTLRSWDDHGKVIGLEVGELRDYAPMVKKLAAVWSRERRAR